MKKPGCILEIIASLKIDAENFYYAVNNNLSARTCKMIANAELRKIIRARKIIFSRQHN